MKLLKNKFQSFFRFSRYERSLLLQALVFLPLIKILLRFFGMGRTREFLEILGTLRKYPTGDEQLQKVFKTTKMLKIAVHNYRFQASCLNQSLLLWWLLRKQGISSNLRIGVRKVQGNLDAHAWVEFQGMIVNDLPEKIQNYSEFSRPVLEVMV